MPRSHICPTFFSTLVFVEILLFITTTPLAARFQAKPFSSAQIGINYVPNAFQNSLGDFWDAGNGGEIFWEMPFYMGTVQAGGRLTSFSRKRNDLPNFHLANYYLQWGYKWSLPFHLKWFTGMRAGNSTMWFGNNAAYPSASNITESELTAGIHSYISYQFLPTWSIRICGDYLKMFTRKRVNLFYISIGIGRSLKLPDWLMKFLE